MLSKRYGIEVHNHALMDAEDEPLIIDTFDNTYTIIVKERVNNRFCDFCKINFKTVADHEIHKNSDYHLESMNNLMGDGPPRIYVPLPNFSINTGHGKFNCCQCGDIYYKSSSKEKRLDQIAKHCASKMHIIGDNHFNRS